MLRAAAPLLCLLALSLAVEACAARAAAPARTWPRQWSSPVADRQKFPSPVISPPQHVSCRLGCKA
jgi:hypothetical protein